MSKYISRNSLKKLIELIKQYTSKFVTYTYNNDTKYLKFKSKERETNINLTSATLFTPGDIVYKCHQNAQFVGGKQWVKLNGVALNRVDYKELFQVLGTKYNDANTQENYFKVPTLLKGNPIGSCVNANNFNVYGQDSYSITTSLLPKISIVSENNSTYSSYRGEHTHLVNFKITNKKGNDTATAWSSSENKNSTSNKENDLSSADYLGKHQHAVKLNSGSQTNFSVVQKMYICGSYYMYTGAKS